MKKIINLIITWLLLTTLVACQEGPAERKGKKIDDAVKSVNDRLQNKGPMQKAGEKVDEMKGN